MTAQKSLGETELCSFLEKKKQRTTTSHGMLRDGSPPNLHNLAKWHLKRIVLISRHETLQTVLAR